ncbi:Putative ribonuclease H protein At1g65750, partial [Linum perenne]
ARQTQLIAWRPEDEGWSTLNTDGSRLTHNVLTAIGGLTRDDQGKFIRAFYANIGNFSITRVELRAIVEGLKVVWSLGIRKLAIQSDLRAVVSIIEREGQTTHQHSALVAEFHELCSREWDIYIFHIYREANCAADYLANFGHSFDLSFHTFIYPDSSLAYWLRYDLLGVTRPRVVSNNI